MHGDIDGITAGMLYYRLAFVEWMLWLCNLSQKHVKAITVLLYIREKATKMNVSYRGKNLLLKCARKGVWKDFK